MTVSIAKCLAPTRRPRKPVTEFPAGSVDTHVHVFASQYELSPDRGYTPPVSTVDDLQNMHRTIGIERVVLTQPSVYGTDNSAILDAVDVLNAETPHRARAVVALDMSVSDEELRRLDDRGVRGIRINTDNKGGMPISWSDLPRMCDRIAPLGWHVEFLFPGREMVKMAATLRDLPVPTSIAHFAYQPAADGVEAKGFQALLSLVRAGNTWVKISGADRVTSVGPPGYDDVAPLAQALLETAPDRIMWATDWPHPNKYDHTPDDGDLVDALGSWIDDPDLRGAVLIDNPALFYHF